jgi:hypothetical protein
MHDELLERHLRATLREDADRLPFTITPAELERRLALRSRRRSDRRLGLLLAAAVGVGLVGVGGALSGLLDFEPGPVPTESPGASGPLPSPSPSLQGPVALPELSDLMAAVPAESVVIAQAHGPASGPEPLPADVEVEPGAGVSLGELNGSTTYEVTFACLGEGQITIDMSVPQGDQHVAVAREDCDGALHRETVLANGPDEVSLRATDRASWRVVLRRLDGAAPTPSAEQPQPLAVPEGHERVIDRQLATVQPGEVDPSLAPLPAQGLGVMPARSAYTLRAWCRDGDAIRYIHAQTFENGPPVPTTTTLIDCDGRVHELQLAVPEPHGSHVYVAADPGTLWSVLVSSEMPPVAIVWEQPGWQLSAGGGPDLSFSTTTMSFTGPGVEGGGPVLAIMDCAGRGAIEVTVDVGVRIGERVESFMATCTPEGAITSHTFEVEGSYVDATWPLPAGMWTALSILVPDP